MNTWIFGCSAEFQSMEGRMTTTTVGCWGQLVDHEFCSCKMLMLQLVKVKILLIASKCDRKSLSTVSICTIPFPMN